MSVYLRKFYENKMVEIDKKKMKSIRRTIQEENKNSITLIFISGKTYHKRNPQ